MSELVDKKSQLPFYFFILWRKQASLVYYAHQGIYCSLLSSLKTIFCGNHDTNSGFLNE